MLLGAEDLRLEVEVSGPVDGELAVAASRSRPVEQVRAFLGWVGEGRALTQTGRVRLADLRELVGLPGLVGVRLRGSASNGRQAGGVDERAEGQVAG
jgi:hypothetical protein